MGVEQYIDSLNLESIQDKTLEQLYLEAQQAKIPALRPQSCRLLFLLTRLKKPARVLEIGTGSGISTLWMHKASPQSVITTLERDKNRFHTASHRFKDNPKIILLNQDIFKYLGQDDTGYDLIFLDAQKRDYIELLPLLESHCRPDSLLITDNILFGGKIIEDQLQDERKYRSGVDRLKAFNHAITHSSCWQTFSLSVEDGLNIAIYTGEQDG